MIADILTEGLVISLTTAENQRIIYANKRFADMCGKPAHEIIGKRLSELYGEQDSVTLEEHIGAGNTGASHRFEFFLPRDDSNHLSAIFSLRRLRVSDERMLLVVSVTDITQLKDTYSVMAERQAMIDADLAVAARVQRSLFPEHLVFDGIEVVTRYLPMLAIGGDYAWVSAHEGRSVHAVVGDVTGHGIAASLIANRLVAESAHYAIADKIPCEMLVGMNRASLSLLGEPGTFCTVAAVRVDIQNRQMCFAGAGHPPAFLARPSGTVQPIYSQYAILGVLEDIGPPGAGVCWPIENGDQLIMYTDGLPEVRNAQGELLGYHRLREVIREAIGASATEMATHILDQVHAFRTGPVEDDATLVVLSVGDS